jgi:hypothetical protein
VAEKRESSQERFDKNYFFELLLNRKKRLEDEIAWATSPKSSQSEDDVIKLLEAEEELDKEIQEFWTNP